MQHRVHEHLHIHEIGLHNEDANTHRKIRHQVRKVRKDIAPLHVPPSIDGPAQSGLFPGAWQTVHPLSPQEFKPT
jgi:hypothetical protein